MKEKYEDIICDVVIKAKAGNNPAFLYIHYIIKSEESSKR